MTSANNFEKVLSLVEHICEELVDDPDLLEVRGTYVGVTGCVEICGPSDEIARVIGVKRATVSALEVLVNAVAAKYGFRILLNVMNTERKKFLENGQGRALEEDGKDD